jgi:hypothetical protein
MHHEPLLASERWCVVFFDLEGRLWKTSVPISRPLLPVFEAVSNSIHAIQQTGRDDGVITVEFMRAGTLLEQGGTGSIDSVIVRDNGSGFTDANFTAFETADTTYKLALGGKGVGRFTWLVAFTSVFVESRYNNGKDCRAFHFATKTGVMNVAGYDPSLLPMAGTTITLNGFKSPWRERCPASLELIAADMLEHFVALFVGSTGPSITLIDGFQKLDLRAEFTRTYDAEANRSQFSVGDDIFSVTGLRLRRSQPVRSHRLLFLAHQREVKSEGLAPHLPGLPNPLKDEKGNFYYVGFVQGKALDDHVDADRSSFRIPDGEDSEAPNLFRQLTWRDLRAGAFGVVRQQLARWLDEIDRDKRARIETFVSQQEPHYQVLLRDVDRIVADLPPSPSSADIDRAMSRRLYERRETLKSESSRLMSEMESVDQADSEAYRGRMEKAVREYNELGMADLARYVCHRRIIIDLFENAIRLQPGKGRYGREDAIHSLIYPMRKTSFDVDFYSHNLWLLDERLAYNWRLYSDVPLSSIDIADISSGKEPDLIIFDHPVIIGDDAAPLITATIVEFKRPGRTDYRRERVTTQVYNYLDLLRSGNFKDYEGRPVELRKDTPVTIYIVADFTKELLLDVRDTTMKRMPDGDGYYAFNDDEKAYVELISYNKLLESARRRNRPFFHVLGLSTMRHH